MQHGVTNALADGITKQPTARLKNKDLEQPWIACRLVQRNSRWQGAISPEKTVRSKVDFSLDFLQNPKT